MIVHIDSKIRNAAKRLNYNTEEAIQKQIDYYNNWNENLDGLNEFGMLKLKKIEPLITLTNYEKQDDTVVFPVNVSACPRPVVSRFVKRRRQI